MWNLTGSERRAARKARAQLIGDPENSKPRIKEPERRRAKTQPGEGALEKSWECVRRMADALPMLVSYVDSQCRYRYNDRAYENWYECSRGVLHGRYVKEMLGETACRVIEG